MIEEAELDGSLGLCVAVMYERSLGSDSTWDGYLQVLPERESVPLVWSLEEADSLLSGTELDKVWENNSFLFIYLRLFSLWAVWLTKFLLPALS